MGTLVFICGMCAAKRERVVMVETASGALVCPACKRETQPLLSVNNA